MRQPPPPVLFEYGEDTDDDDDDDEDDMVIFSRLPIHHISLRVCEYGVRGRYVYERGGDQREKRLISTQFFRRSACKFGNNLFKSYLCVRNGVSDSFWSSFWKHFFSAGFVCHHQGGNIGTLR